MIKSILLSLFFPLSFISYCQKTDSSSFFFTKVPVHAEPIVDKNVANIASTNNYLPTIIPPSPNASSLGKFGEIPVNLSSGLPNVSIPIFSLNEKKIKLNLAIDYNYSGFKLYEQPNLLGRGWSLKSGGIITRLQKDIPDEKNVNSITGYSVASNRTSIAQLLTQAGNLNCSGNGCPSCFATRQCDGEPDIFYFSIGDMSGKFFFGEDGQIHVVADRKLIINYQKFTTSVPIYNGEFTNIYSFTLTTEDGTIYKFGDPANSISEIVNTRRNVEFSWGYSTFSTLCDGCYSSTISAWYLREIESVDGDKVTFDYTNDYRLATNDPASNRTRLTASPYQNNVSASNGQEYSNSDVFNYSFSTENLLTKISATNWNIVLTYNDLASANLHTLNSISLNTKDNTLVKKYQFGYTGQNARTLLDKVTEIGSDLTENPPYQFQYYSAFPSTSVPSNSIDYWGYYNDNTINSLIPVAPYNANRNPNFSRTLIAALQKITYPTKGTTEFEYEQNEYSFLRDSPSMNGTNIGRRPYGGIRVKQMTDYSEGTTIAKFKKYYYNKFDDATRSSGVVSAPINFNELNIATTQSGGLGTPWNQVPDVTVTYNVFSSEPYYSLSVLPIYYFNVKEEIVGNGYSEHIFSSHFDYNDNLGVNFGYATNLVGPSGSYDFARNMPKNVKNFDVNGTLLSQKTTQYQLNDRHTARTLWRQQILTTNGGTSFQFAKGLKTISGWLKKTLETDIVYNGTAALTTNTSYLYENNYLQVRKITTTEGKAKSIFVNTTLTDSRSIETIFKYPFDFPTSTVYNAMTARNIIIPTIEKTTQLYELDDFTVEYFTPISFERTTYNLFGTAYLPQKIEVKIGNGTLYTPITFDTYDARSNLTKYTTRSGQTATMQYFGTSDIGKTDLLRRQIIGGGSTGAELTRDTEYDYFPLVGVKSIKDINNYTSTFQYDVFNRLVSVKDPQTYLLKDLNYHYANQAALTGLGITPTNAMNYIVSRTAREAQTGTALASDVDKTTTQLEYMDGLGRSLQALIWKGTPDKLKDIVSATTEYDNYGRAYKSILPTPSDVFTGAYKNSAESLANAFYVDSYPYSETIFEASPLNRPIKQFGAGQAWRTVGNEKFTTIQYFLAGNGIIQFNVQSDGSISGATNYADATLYNNCVLSERGFQTYELKDKQGRVTHKFQQLQSGFTYAITAYCYNNQNQLVAVISPEAYQKFGTGTGQITNLAQSNEIFKELCFFYVYDDLGRVIEKHVPGAGWKYSVYNVQDLEVFFADDADKAQGYWQFRKFDALGREIQGGIKTGIGSVSRATIQTAFDGFTGQNYEEYGSVLGYTNVSFPSTYTVLETDIKRVTYYDNYFGWQTDGDYEFKGDKAFHLQGFSKGLVTGSLVRNLETNAWYKLVNYHDYKGQIIQQFSQNNVGGIDRMDYQYRFNNEVLKMRMTHRKTGVKDLVELYEYAYDHVGRKTSFTHNSLVVAKYEYDAISRLQGKKFRPVGTTQGSSQTGSWTDASSWLSGVFPLSNDNVTINTGHTLTIPAGQIASAGVLNDKGTLRNFGTLNMGKVPTADLYAQTFQYKIRGGLKGMNLDNAGNLTNTLFSFKLAYEDGTGEYYDGNIRNQYWKSNIDGVQRAYEYSYDGASRITGATYSGRTSESYDLNAVSYDFNGNIKTLSRNGWRSNNSFGLVDNLNYTYNINSNKTLKVDDSSNETASFRDVAGNDYGYSLDGSLTSDANKGITLIEYNYLKLPRRVVQNGVTTLYQYDASGKKLKETIGTNFTDYSGNKIYENGALYQISHDEGRIVDGQYEYFINDHLGNLRVSFRDSSGIAKISQKQDYDPYGSELQQISYLKSAWKKSDFKFSGKEFESQTGLNDFGWRRQDPILGRMWGIDNRAEKYYSQSPMQFALNNPIMNVEANGDTVTVIGSQDAQKQLLQVINQGLGGYYTGSINSNGQLTIAQTNKKGEISKSQSAFAETLNQITQGKNISVGVTQNDTQVLGGDYSLETIDISDISKFENGEAMSSSSVLAHELTEQFNKQSNHLGESGYKESHELGKQAEKNITGYKRDESSIIQKVGRDALGNPVGTIQINYTKRGVTKPVTIYQNNLNITKVKQ